MGDQLTRHFHVSEFMCRDGEPVPRELLPRVQLLAEQLEILRRHIKRPIVVLSGFRTAFWNARVKGVAKSRHLTAEAADIRVASMDADEVHAAVESLTLRGRMRDGGVGRYPGFVHIDIGPAGRRWRG